MTPVVLPPVFLTAEPPNPRLPNGRRGLAFLAALVAAWMIAAPRAAHADEIPGAALEDGRDLSGYTFSVAACTPDRSWCSEILSDPTIRPLEGCKALAPVFDGPAAHYRVLGATSPDKLVLAWACTPQFALPGA